GRWLTSARTARLPAPSVSFAACSVPSFKPQMATRAPSRSNSCAAASPIPLLPPVIRICLFASLPMVVTPGDGTCPWRLYLAEPAKSEAAEPVVRAAHMVLLFASSFSGAAARRYCKNETSHKPLMYVYVDRHWGAELSAIAEYSAPLLGTTVHGAG